MDHREWVDGLFRDHAKELVRYLRGFPLPEEDAYDLVQDAFVKLMGMRPSDLRQPKAWLFTVARRQAINALRRNRISTGDPDVERLEDGSKGPLALLLEDEAQAMLLQAFSRLPPGDREMMSLHLEHGFRYRQLAGILGRSEISVRVAMHRIRNQLKKWVRSMEGSNDEECRQGRKSAPEEGTRQKTWVALERSSNSCR